MWASKNQFTAKMEKVCIICNQLYIPIARNQKYCSQACRVERQRRQYIKTANWGLDCSTVGVLSELIVSVDLLQKGYEVFRGVSPSCTCDLAILKDGKLLRVEVKTGHYMADGSLKAYVLRNPRSNRFDILAIVSSDGKTIKYEGDF